ncbi:hypothetical protein EAE91_20875 [Photorhabdus noenieputensis]|uniref:hypothetical protein n=1 Tax=Photorhabdus noenieputensis TaxID=1208607 RepID=UPI001BD1EE89|nr:hypothetical protein [Photorhabdus noenieputensis]MBS9439505.1 hypothetical protein [Photorhabdus noenieputensis]MCK3669667.1 hypothetical protein [Photorhabdus noenieputensis]
MSEKLNEINLDSDIKYQLGTVTEIDLDISEKVKVINVTMDINNVASVYFLDLSLPHVNINRAMALLVTLVNSFYQKKPINVGLQADIQGNYSYIMASKVEESKSS